MEAPTLPKVSVLMGAYNYALYVAEAIESAINQDYPPELLELVIVDDGSTDNTAEVVNSYVDRYPGRIKFVQQQNTGATGATNRARREADGDLIALLDADDVWLPDKTRRQVDLFLSDPELGLTFTRMRLIDGDGNTIHNNYGHQEPIPQNQFARVLWENIAVQSSLIVRAGLFDRIPSEAPYADWWLTLVAAQFMNVAYIPEDLVLYRWHGANITGGVSGPKALREAQKGIEFQRWVLRTFELTELTSRLTPSEMSYVWSGLENQAQKGLSGLRSHFGLLALVTDSDRASAQADSAAAQDALDEGDFRTGCALLLRARAADPYDAELRTRFDAAVAAAEVAARLPDPLTGNRGFAIVAEAAFLLADDRHLRDYANALRAVSASTLVIDASALDPAEAGPALQSLVERCGLSDDDDVHMLGLIGPLAPSQRFHIQSEARACYAALRPHEQGINETPVFTPESLDELRDLAEAWQQSHMGRPGPGS